MVVPEFKCPITPWTLASTNFWAAAVPCFGSAASSSANNSNLTTLSPILMPAAFSSSMAILAPFSLSLPKWAMAPLVGPTWPILMTWAPPPSFLPQATSVKTTAATATAVRGVLREDNFMNSSEIMRFCFNQARRNDNANLKHIKGAWSVKDQKKGQKPRLIGLCRGEIESIDLKSELRVMFPSLPGAWFVSFFRANHFD